MSKELFESMIFFALQSLNIGGQDMFVGGYYLYSKHKKKETQLSPLFISLLKKYLLF